MAETKHDKQFAEAFKRIGSLEVHLAAHLATCTEVGKNATSSHEMLSEKVTNGFDEQKTTFATLEKKVDGLRQDRAKIRGGVLALRVVAALIVTASVIGNIYWVLSR